MQKLYLSPAGVRGEWLRHGSETRHKRLIRVEQHPQEETHMPSAEQIESIERHSVAFRCRRVESSEPGELLHQGKCSWGTLGGVGRVYVQVVRDTSGTLAVARVYANALPITGCDLSCDPLLSLHEAL